MNLFDSALEDFFHAINLEPENANYVAAPGFSYHTMGDYPLALEHLDRALEIDPINWEIIHERAKILERLGRIKDAIKDYQRVLQLNPMLILMVILR